MDRTAAAFTFLLLGLAVLCHCASPPPDKICIQDHITTFSNTTECCLCDDANETNRCSHNKDGCKTSFHFCQGYCVTHKFFVNNTWSISRRCGRQTECEIYWKKTFSNPNCFNDQNPTNDTICFFCCRSPSPLCPFFCSGSKYINFSITATVPTTTLTTMKSTTRRTMPTTIIPATPTITDRSTTTTARVKSCEVCVSDNGVDCTHKTITHCSMLEPYCMNTITSTNVTKIRKSCATDSECYWDWWLITKPNPNCQGNLTGTGVCHYCCETLEGSVMPCNTEAIPTNLKSYTIPDSICHIGTGTDVHEFKEEICPSSAPFCLNTVSLDQQSRTEIVRKRCAEEIECLSDWWNSTRTRPECFHANGTGLTVQTNSHGESCHYCCLSKGTTTPCNLHNIPDQSLLMNFTTATSIPELPKSSTTTSGHKASTINSVTIAPPQLPKSSTTTSGHKASTINSVTIAPPHFTKGSTTKAGHEPSSIHSATIAPPPLVTHLKNNVSTSTIKTTQGEPFNCYVCPYGGNYFVPVSQECADNHHFCMNTIEDKRDGTRIMEKRCATEDDCFQKWWQESSDQEVCKKLFELGDSPSRQDLSCHFCCTEDYCNYFTTPDKSQLYDGNNFHG